MSIGHNVFSGQQGRQTVWEAWSEEEAQQATATVGSEHHSRRGRPSSAFANLLTSRYSRLRVLVIPSELHDVHLVLVLCNDQAMLQKQKRCTNMRRIEQAFARSIVTGPTANFWQITSDKDLVVVLLTTAIFWCSEHKVWLFRYQAEAGRAAGVEAGEAWRTALQAAAQHGASQVRSLSVCIKGLQLPAAR